jgi:hypothetical protein
MIQSYRKLSLSSAGVFFILQIMEWFQGEVYEAISASKSFGTLLLVLVHGKGNFID